MWLVGLHHAARQLPDFRLVGGELHEFRDDVRVAHRVGVQQEEPVAFGRFERDVVATCKPFVPGIANDADLRAEALLSPFDRPVG